MKTKTILLISALTAHILTLPISLNETNQSVPFNEIESYSMEWGNFDSSIQLRLSIHDKNDKYYKRLELPSKTIVAYFQANNQNFKSNKQPQYTLSTHKTLAHAAMYPYMHMHSQEDIEDILRLKEGIYCPNITQNNNGAIIFNTTDPSNCEEFKKWFEREQAWFEKYKSTPKENN